MATLQQKMHHSAGEDKPFENKLTYQLPRLFHKGGIYKQWEKCSFRKKQT